jgi:hydroxycarboxylate dehydrogenase B
MQEQTKGEVLIAPARLNRFINDICRHAGCDAEEAAAIADHLVDANLTGHDSHGACKIPEYVGCMRDGRLKLGQRASIVSDAGAVLVLNGNLGVGQVLARQAMEMGMERARSLGAAVVALRRAHHIGRIGAWAEQCAAAGFASMHYVNVIGHAPYVAPFGGRDGRLATNPFCAALPVKGNPPVVLDMATSKVAWGKLLVAANKGAPAPEDAVLDPEGNASLDPQVMFREPKGAMLPFGEHKGAGLAVLCDLMAGALGGGGCNRPENNDSSTAINNMLSVIIRSDALGDPAEIAAEANGFAAWTKSSRLRPGAEPVQLPGEPERARRAARQRNGIALDRTTWGLLLETARSVGYQADEGRLLAPASGAVQPE